MCSRHGIAEILLKMPLNRNQSIIDQQNLKANVMLINYKLSCKVYQDENNKILCHIKHPLN